MSAAGASLNSLVYYQLSYNGLSGTVPNANDFPYLQYLGSAAPAPSQFIRLARRSNGPVRLWHPASKYDGVTNAVGSHVGGELT